MAFENTAIHPLFIFLLLLLLFYFFIFFFFGVGPIVEFKNATIGSSNFYL